MKETHPNTAAKKLQVLFFGSLAETAGTSGIEMECPDDTEKLKETLLLLYPALKTQVFKIAVNQKISTERQELKSGDEIALLAPFAGG
jgi:molybdopterin converting factor small subunit